MAAKTHWWITLWFLLTAPIILWDAGFCFMRPRSFVGGDLHWIWEPYAIQSQVDLVYGEEAYKRGDGFPNAAALMNVVETAFNLYYVFLQHIVSSPSAPLIGFAGALMTLAKTALYWAQEYYCNGCAVGHNSLQDLILMWALPNSLWLLIPGLIVYVLGNDIASTLRFSDKLASKKKQK